MTREKNVQGRRNRKEEMAENEDSRCAHRGSAVNRELVMKAGVHTESGLRNWLSWSELKKTCMQLCGPKRHVNMLGQLSDEGRQVFFFSFVLL